MSTRIQILDAGEQLARARGLEAFSYADLEKAVGIRKASIHHHFKSKADLALALIERYSERFADALRDIEDAHVTPQERLRAFTGLYRDALAGGEQVCLCVAFAAGRESLPGTVALATRSFQEMALAWLEVTFNELNTPEFPDDPQDEAAAFLALLEGAQIMARGASDPALFDAAIRPFIRRLGVTGLKA
ncbi:TetR/AcrR family transcriptional regulator [Parvularcula sp. ZS-1/3]|uniref:TetR/AcrR family transcriptional regulator n=1 Tax=Parvularcula mediterranea TaxID=2732508 RepID=A0A7Y3W5F4_9PROT|nr:TetR/AcrR family transcriptional regulator [Parvularcula mediterranea]NNU16730.1 TetR/AcrR family transcriptional regulator [Parvularcula mediterranea]